MKSQAPRQPHLNGTKDDSLHRVRKVANVPRRICNLRSSGAGRGCILSLSSASLQEFSLSLSAALIEFRKFCGSRVHSHSAVAVLGSFAPKVKVGQNHREVASLALLCGPTSTYTHSTSAAEYKHTAVCVRINYREP